MALPEPWIHKFNANLLKVLESAPIRSKRLREALVYAAQSPGKRLRPLFARESGDLSGLAPEASNHVGIALECVHLFSLIHDDLPALDNDDLRRGQPTLHRKFDEGTALLAGDEFLNFAYSEFTGAARFASPEAFQLALRLFSRSIGGDGMIGGQMLELEFLHESRTPELEELLRVQDLKTGALFRASILTPLLLSGDHPESKKFEAFQNYSNAFGFAFQIADDLEDEAQDQAQSRKNILSFLGRESAIRLAVERLESSPVSPNFSATAFLIERLKSKT